MKKENDKYISPFSTRYASKEMQKVFSDDFKFITWRKLWIILAKAQKKLGLKISEEQIVELESNLYNINYDVAKERERIVKHDVMSHLYAYSKQCPKAEPILHLGATSCYIVDNTDIIILREASKIILKKATQVLKNLCIFSEKYKALPCLSYTHLQPAQVSTVGKRATLWMYDLVQDINELVYRLENLLLLGSKGTTGTQASFMKLFENNERKVDELEEIICKELNFKGCVPVSGQTYSRKIDTNFLSTMSGFAQSSYKFSNDLRILQSFEEIEEPFEENQVGSSAMPYKRNPIRSERMSALSRFVIINSLNPAFTAGTQWLERTLDDSANKRISVSECFLAVDSILNLYINITSGLVVYEGVILKRLKDKLPFMATENILMNAVKKGGNRQILHEKLRKYSHSTIRDIKIYNKENNLIEKIINDTEFNLSADEVNEILSPNLYIGRSISQVERFIKNVATPIIDKYLKKDIEVDFKV